MNKSVATLGPLGYLPAPGTCGSIAALPCAYVLSYVSPCHSILAILVITLASFFCIQHALKHFKQPDPSAIILDEFVAVLWLYWHIAYSYWWLLIAFLLFRFFDITKIGINYWEQLPGAWGVLSDDIAAVFVTRLALIIITWSLY